MQLLNCPADDCDMAFSSPTHADTPMCCGEPREVTGALSRAAGKQVALVVRPLPR